MSKNMIYTFIYAWSKANRTKIPNVNTVTVIIIFIKMIKTERNY